MATGAVIGILLGAGPRRRAYRLNANGAPLAGAFGALVGGVIADGVPHALAGEITIGSLIGSLVGALLFCCCLLYTSASPRDS